MYKCILKPIYHNTPPQSPKIQRAFTYKHIWQSSKHHIQTFANLAKHLEKPLLLWIKLCGIHLVKTEYTMAISIEKQIPCSTQLTHIQIIIQKTTTKNDCKCIVYLITYLKMQKLHCSLMLCDIFTEKHCGFITTSLQWNRLIGTIIMDVCLFIFQFSCFIMIW